MRVIMRRCRAAALRVRRHRRPASMPVQPQRVRDRTLTRCRVECGRRSEPTHGAAVNRQSTIGNLIDKPQSAIGSPQSAMRSYPYPLRTS
jgi:hypothetical protein